MRIEEKIFKIQLEKGASESVEVNFIAGLAQLAIDKGYDLLSEKERIF